MKQWRNSDPGIAVGEYTTTYLAYYTN